MMTINDYILCIDAAKLQQIIYLAIIATRNSKSIQILIESRFVAVFTLFSGDLMFFLMRCV